MSATSRPAFPPKFVAGRVAPVFDRVRAHGQTLDGAALRPSLERENPDLLASPYTDTGTILNLKFPYAAARDHLGTGGWAREITARELPIATMLAGVNMRLNPGGIREMHWHREAEWAFMLTGRCRITAIDPQIIAALGKDKSVIVK